MYFFVNKDYERIGMKINFYCLLCEKDRKQSVILDNIVVGTVMVDLFGSWKSVYPIRN